MTTKTCKSPPVKLTYFHR